MFLLTYVDEITVDEKAVRAVRHTRGGEETVEAALPAVCSVTEKANSSRSANIRGKMNAKKAVLINHLFYVLGCFRMYRIFLIYIQCFRIFQISVYVFVRYVFNFSIFFIRLIYDFIVDIGKIIYKFNTVSSV